LLPEKAAVRGGFNANGLYGDGAADHGIDRLVDDTHAASFQFARDLETAYLLHCGLFILIYSTFTQRAAAQAA